MNSFPLSFVVHDGDFKDPKTVCSDNRFTEVKESFNKSKAPFVYVAGRQRVDGLHAERQYDPNGPSRAPRQAAGDVLRPGRVAGPEPHAAHDQRQQGYPENARWTKEGVVFATLNAPGPSDNLA